nr:alpha/beta fold hydrolase [Burkholderiales bacterium]
FMFIDVGDAKLYATAFGPRTAPAIVAIGGWIGSWELWAEPFSILSERWRTVAYDHRGSGATVAPVESITFANLVTDLFAVLDAHGIETCTLAAESAGAQTALGAALRESRDARSVRPALHTRARL